MARYGIPYQGSKNKIADWVLKNLPESKTFVDVFSGGCAMTHCALLSDKYENYIVNDIGDGPLLFKDAVNGKFAKEKRWISRAEFLKLKDKDPYIGCCWSFNNDEKAYLYRKNIEDWKEALWYARVKNDFSKFEAMGIDTDGTTTDIKKHHEEYKRQYVKWYLKKYYDVDIDPALYEKTLEIDIKTEKEKLRNYLLDALKRSGLKQSDVNKRLGTQNARHYFGCSQWMFPTREKYGRI